MPMQRGLFLYTVLEHDASRAWVDRRRRRQTDCGLRSEIVSETRSASPPSTFSTRRASESGR